MPSFSVERDSATTLLAFIETGCTAQNRALPNDHHLFELAANRIPARTLWVWERPEDLNSVDPRTTAIATPIAPSCSAAAWPSSPAASPTTIPSASHESPLSVSRRPAPSIWRLNPPPPILSSASFPPRPLLCRSTSTHAAPSAISTLPRCAISAAGCPCRNDSRRRRRA